MKRNRGKRRESIGKREEKADEENKEEGKKEEEEGEGKEECVRVTLTKASLIHTQKYVSSCGVVKAW